MWKENQIQGEKWVLCIGDIQEIVSIDDGRKAVFHFLPFALYRAEVHRSALCGEGVG